MARLSGMGTDAVAEGSAISLPKGGGAISGLGETFAPDLFSGTGNATVPIALPTGRHGLTPHLALAYSTGAGNGAFGLGWQLSLPGVCRKTSRGVPRYVDGDIFVLAGADDLVPVASTDPDRARYRPRTEGLFARIEHVTGATGDYWEVRSRDGLLTRYGSLRPPDADAGWRDPAAVADPADPTRVFAWRVTATQDPLGNRIRYGYQRDIGREPGHQWDQPLLTRVSYVDYGDPADPAFLVEVGFGYEARPDPFSDYRAGFEQRTSMRCTTIRITTNAADGVRRISREYRLGYDQAAFNGLSLLTRVDVVGIDGDAEESLPPLRFAYTGFDPTAARFAPVAGPGLPAPGLAGPDITLVDVHGVGLPDVVELGATARVWPNLGAGTFGYGRALVDAPPLALGSPGVQLLDADGDGRPDLVVAGPDGRGQSAAGFYPMSFAGGWSRRSFQPYRHSPSVSLADPNVKLIDLDGDGLTDIIASGTRLVCWFNDPDPRLAWQRTFASNGAGPSVDLADPAVRLADMTGDGLQDLVVVRNGKITYWPNLGHGRWGEPVTMRGAPRLADGLDPRRLMLGDLDGDGAADLVLVDHGRVLVWGNQSGNAWTGQPVVIAGTPDVVDTDDVRLVDLFGAGLAGLLFSRPDDGSGRPRLRFLDLTGGVKPYLLSIMDNGLGATTRMTYGTSTAEYLRDQRTPGTRWLTTLPFPVHVVTGVDTLDAITGGRLTRQYRYHHGYWDGHEREFRGFGQVVQIDTETFPADGDEQHAPPTLTRSWFHLGPVAATEAGDWTELDLSAEYSTVDPTRLTRPADQVALLAGLSRRERRDALRAMRGQVLRTELYAVDGAPTSSRPYTVTETVVGLRSEAPGVYFPFTVASRTTQWERGDEPMTQLAYPLGYDGYGQPTGHLAVAVPRGRDPFAAEARATAPYLATYATTQYARRDDPGHYLIDRVARTTTFEVVNDGRLPVGQLRDAVAGQSTPDSVSLRVIGDVRTYFDGDEFAGLPLGTLNEHGLPVRSESLAFTDDFLAGLGPAPVYLAPDAPPAWTEEYPREFRDRLPSLAGYVHYGADAGGVPAGYYVTGARHRYDVHVPGRTARGLVLDTLDPLGAGSAVEYDQHDLLPVRATDAAGLVTTAVADYRVLRPAVVTDVNGNSSSVTFSPLGLVTARFVRGRDGEGDRSAASTQMTYDLAAFTTRGLPSSVRTVRRAHHDTDPVGGDEVLVAVEFSDGFGRTIQTRTQAEDTLFGDETFGGGVIPTDQLAAVGSTSGRVRQPSTPDNVVVSGWQVFDNKGRVVRRYEPFFSASYDYGQPGDTELGQHLSLFYDPRGQLLRTVNPDGSHSRTVPGVPTDLTDPDQYTPTPWEAYRYDANDNAGRTDAAAAQSYVDHWNTPASVEVDALGRTIRSVVRNGADPAAWFTTTSTYDIQGNLVQVTDPLGRPAFRYVFDLAKRRWRMDGLDTGRRDTVPDAFGHAVETRDSKGALTLEAFDVLRRPARAWARDDAAGPVTLRQVVQYGDAGDPAQPAADRAAAQAHNLLGRPIAHHDEAGLVTLGAVDFKGNVLESTRRVIADATLLAAYDGAAATGWRITAFQVDWTVPPGQSLMEVESRLLESVGYVTTSTYDALNRIATHTLPSDVDSGRRVLRPAYNRAGRLEQLSLDDTVYVQRLAYDAQGRRTLIAHGNGVMTRYAYDPRTLRLARLRSEPYQLGADATYSPHGTVVQDYGYTHDLVGNVLALHDRTPGSGIPGNPDALGAGDPTTRALLGAGDALDRRFGYDPLYRLRSATGREFQAPSGDPWVDQPRGTDVTMTQAYAQTYTYDPVGGLVELSHSGASPFTRTYTTGPANRLRRMMAGPTPYDYTYDDNGNLTAETTTRHFGWDHADRLRTFATQVLGSEPSVHTQYLYDSQGQRVKKLVRRQGGSVEVTHYLDEVFEHHRWSGSAGGQNNHIHVLDDHQRVALVRVGPAHPDDRGPAVAVHLADHLGSSAVVLDETGAVTNREEYTPYGETSFGSFTRKRYRFTGMERDEESGLAYHAARYLAPWLARWLSTDPAAPGSGINPYLYVADNPVRLVDPSGLGVWDRVWGGVKAVGGALETAAGAAMVGFGAATSWTGVGIGVAVLGGVVMAHGADTVVSGVRTAASGTPTDTFTSQGLQALGMSRRAANLVDAGISVAGTLGASAFARAPVVANAVNDARAAAGAADAAAAGTSNAAAAGGANAAAAGTAPADALVHLTKAESAAAINATSTLGKGASQVYAGPASLARSGPVAVAVKTGLAPGTANAVVAVPNAAASAFRVPVVVGPVTLWQRIFGTVYTAGAGSINLTTGVFTRTGVGWNQVRLITADGLVNAGVRASEALNASEDRPTHPDTPAASPSADGGSLMHMRDPAPRAATTTRHRPDVSITRTLSGN